MAINPEDFKLDPTGVSEDEMQEAIKLLEAKRVRDARIAAGEIKGTYTKPYSELTEEEKKKVRQYAQRRLARQNIIIRKAIEQGITCTDAEIDAELAKKASGAAA